MYTYIYLLREVTIEIYLLREVTPEMCEALHWIGRRIAQRDTITGSEKYYIRDIILSSETGGEIRKFKPEWLVRFPWLAYSKYVDSKYYVRLSYNINNLGWWFGDFKVVVCGL